MQFLLQLFIFNKSSSVLLSKRLQVKVRTLLIISAISTSVMMLIMILHGAPLKIPGFTPYGMISLEFAGTVSRATEIYQNWYPDLTALAIKNIRIDFLFLISYGIFLCTCCLILSRYYSGAWSRAGRWLSALMITAAAFDALENTLMFSALVGHIRKELIASMYMFASIKFLLVALGIVYIVFSLIGRLFIPKKKLVRLQDN